MSLLVVGSVAFDSIKTPFGSRERALGGSATYFAVASSFFTSPAVIAAVGGDFGLKERAVFHERKIDISELVVVEEGKTFHWVGEYGFDLNTAKTLATELNVFGEFQPSLSPASSQSRYVFLANIQPRLQLQVRRQATEARLVAMDTMNYWISGDRDALVETMSNVDLVMINDAEVREFAREANLLKATRKILELGPETVVVKRGEYGAAMIRRDSYFATPAFPLERVFDPTGAGDSFAGGFLGYLAATDNLDEASMRRAMIYGSVMASFDVEEFGCERLRRLTYREITERYRQFRAMTHFDDVVFEKHV